MMRPASYLLILLVPLLPVEVMAQAHDGHAPDGPVAHGLHPRTSSGIEAQPEVAAFLERARQATHRYHDVNAAIAAGYRLIGPDFPGMGEHWVNVRLAVQDTLDPARPPVLTYLPLHDERIFTGVAYALPLLPGEEPPAFPFPGAWHHHTGTIDEETLFLNPEAMHHRPTDQTRLAMVHAWLWTDNPNGLFEADNWALPFLRLGLPVPETIPPAAGKALFLLTGGVTYYSQLIRLASAPPPDEAAVIDELLATYRDRTARLVDEHHLVEAPSPAALGALSDLWQACWTDIERHVSTGVWKHMEPLAR